MALSNPGCNCTATEKEARTVLRTCSQTARTFTHAAQQSAPHLPIRYYLGVEVRGTVHHVRITWRLCCSLLMWYFFYRVLWGLARCHGAMAQRGVTARGGRNQTRRCPGCHWGTDAGVGNALSHVCAPSAEKLAEATTAPEVTGSRGDRQFSSRACLPALFYLVPQ